MPDLPANQIGVSLRAFSWNIDGNIGYVLNPEIVENHAEYQELGDEGCLSVPGLWYPCERPLYAKAVGTDLDGNEVVVEGEEIWARLVNHEVDHLERQALHRPPEQGRASHAPCANCASNWSARRTARLPTSTTTILARRVQAGGSTRHGLGAVNVTVRSAVTWVSGSSPTVRIEAGRHVHGDHERRRRIARDDRGRPVPSGPAWSRCRRCRR